VNERWLALLVMVMAGGLVAMQAPINSALGKVVGSFQAAAWSFTVGLIALVALATLSGGFGGAGRARELDWYYLVGGGLIGATYVTSVLILVRTLGAGGVTAATIAGQLTTAVALDHFGVLGLERNPLTLTRLAGVGLLCLGTLLIIRK
jgi:transporter family-2 protein